MFETDNIQYPSEREEEKVGCLAHSSTMKMEATFSCETSVDFQRTTGRYFPEDRMLYNHRCENLRSYIRKIELVTEERNRDRKGKRQK
jgi:hypothetical protein